ncbi:MAG: methylmalonyl-CoA mutase family protein [Bacteroidetes bacterium]|jgi:isobutyryl-CoA mutase|nr:methylmalonyl-CoA mutase family protein [Bacteroidota bacterium]MBT5529430.1 methylmalonyl-CoA mutase family protein [Cytophagia bacterium]MBT3424109.1 methylmalonyl-CoA mutase family protein [Bacteroidota bacterium]MBT3935195.1 methylmalonyl-CoA mutase family protein [Bacteroidota bacterium]MBT4337815.1 methylmalonyl-CoA mutase family protein [Bacteroidota bacterium]
MLTIYKPKNHIRIVTAASLFDGHDAAINIMRRIIQASGVEVIHLGHDRSVQEIVDCAIQEDVQAIAITSYQGGHMEFFKYMYDLLKEQNCEHIKIFGGGGGVILPDEIKELQAYGITRIYSPDDGRTLGLQGMINDLIEQSDFPTGLNLNGELKEIEEKNVRSIGRIISAAENYPESIVGFINNIKEKKLCKQSPVLGITGTGGAGKSSMVDELVRRFLDDFPEKTIGIISVDPSKRKTGGALLGDRIRMNSIHNPRVYMRSLATRQSNLAMSKYVQDAVCVLAAANYDLIILETSGIGQSDTEIIDHSDVSLYVMTPEYGAATQLEKIDMLDFADVIALNKFDKRGSLDALRDVRKQYQRNHQLWEQKVEEMPVYGTIASQFNDPGVNELYRAIINTVVKKTGKDFESGIQETDELSEKIHIIPPNRVRYLSEITDTIRQYNKWSEDQAEIAQKLYNLTESISLLAETDHAEAKKSLETLAQSIELELDRKNKMILDGWEEKTACFQQDEFVYKVRDKEIKVETFTKSLSHSKIPKISFPKYKAWGDILKWILRENFPGEFPYAAGVFPFKREGEDPTRMFAGEGGPERTNKRFHYVSVNMPAKRLSTAFDSVTLYGRDPDRRPDIYGKIGNAGVSICCLDDAKKLYSGFDLVNPKTSVSMTINGPAPAMVGYFMNAAIDQNCEKYIIENGLVDEINKKIEAIFKEKGTKRPAYQGKLPEGNNGLGLMLLGVCGEMVLPADVYSKIKADTICAVRGTVQADILKEDQAQNTCIFSTDFSLKLMGDIQSYFIDNYVRNFYSVSISGYHIAEAGANPISQLAFTLANGFTYVEYYLSRGMNIDDFAPNLSFFFSNGIDPEYSVLGRVARLIWAKAMKMKYGGNARSQMLKYHIQTSGRSLHAQEIDFNDIRTTLQALYAIYDNCNSLHTNAYDEAITTPTEESVRRAVAIQMIINHELGLAKNQNPLQGSFIIEELTDLVEEAVMAEFDRITERGGVLGAMETMYQRGKIQEESLYYETLKHTGELPIMGVNTWLSSTGSPTTIPGEVIRATEEEKEYQIGMLEQLHQTYQQESESILVELKDAAIKNKNIFNALMEATKVCSIGQITSALFEVGGQYRRNM